MPKKAAPKPKKTSPKVASVASRALADPAGASDAEVASLAASALVQAEKPATDFTSESSSTILVSASTFQTAEAAEPALPADPVYSSLELAPGDAPSEPALVDVPFDDSSGFVVTGAMIGEETAVLHGTDASGAAVSETLTIEVPDPFLEEPLPVASLEDQLAAANARIVQLEAEIEGQKQWSREHARR